MADVRLGPETCGVLQRIHKNLDRPEIPYSLQQAIMQLVIKAVVTAKTEVIAVAPEPTEGMPT